ncbi:MAG: hypothetical protein JXA71_12270, partial [Chitinispirillaceae bacterium]|nr:hypothetical protein [Chitinispirillaceae bacterium]
MKRVSTPSRPLTITGALLFAVALVISCTRDNPFDINNPDYRAGTKPRASFVDTIITGYIYDTISIKIVWADTAVGGKKGAIKRYYFDWNGTGTWSDSANGTAADTFIVKRSFGAQNAMARLIALDYEDSLSAIDSVPLIIMPSVPEITGIQAPATVQKSVPFTITVSATDAGGVITSFLWAFNSTEFTHITPTGVLDHTFNETGVQTVYVKARDNKNIESDVRSTVIRVVDQVDTTAPQITFISPLNLDTLQSRNALVLLQVSDESGISSVTVNDVAFQESAGVWRGTVVLQQGENLLAAVASDKTGNSSSISIRVFYSPGTVDTDPPVILMMVPPRMTDTVSTEILTIRLMALDQSGIATVFLGDELMEQDPKDSSYFITVALASGPNAFEVRATDRIGNSGSDTLRIVYESDMVDTMPPVITITEPRFMQHIADTQVLARGTVTDASKILQFLVNGTGAQLNYPNWNGMVRLKHGYDTVVVSAVDASVNRNESQRSLVIIQNYPPRFTDAPRDTQVIIGSTLSCFASATDDDTALSFVLLHSIVHSVSLPQLIASRSGATVSYMPTAPGIDTFMLITRDPWDDADTAQWRVFIGAPNDSAPVFITDARTLPDSVIVANTYRATVQARDPNNQPITYSLVRPTTPDGMAINSASGAITWVPAEADTGVRHIIVQASNGRHRDTLEWDITVFSLNYPPVLTLIANKTTNEGQALEFELSATDANDDPLDFLFGSRFPAGAQIVNGDRFSWTPGYSDSGQHTVEVIVRERTRVPPLSDTGTFLITVTNVLPQVPTLRTPLDGAASQPVSLTLRWYGAAAATSYHLQLATDTGFSAPVFEDSTISQLYQTVIGLANNTAYFWRVKARNPGGQSGWSARWRFTTINATPGVPSLVWPSNNETDVQLDPTLRWSAVTGASSYRVQVATQPAFSNPVLNQSVSGTSQAVSGLLPAAKYYWRVNATVSGITGDWATDSFTTLTLAPPAPVQTSPPSNALNVALNSPLAWNASAGAGSYGLQVSTVSSFSVRVVDLSGLTTRTRTVTGLANGTKYYWRVNAANAGGTSAWSTDSFTTIVAPPPAPVLNSPADNALNVPINPTVTWNPAAGAGTYGLQVSTVSNFSSTVVNLSGTTATSRAVTGLANNTTYYWRVNAANAAGPGPWSSTRSFTTIIAAPPAPVQATPANNATGVPINPTMTWNPAAGAGTYGLQVSTVSNFSS